MMHQSLCFRLTMTFYLCANCRSKILPQNKFFRNRQWIISLTYENLKCSVHWVKRFFFFQCYFSCCYSMMEKLGSLSPVPSSAVKLCCGIGCPICPPGLQVWSQGRPVLLQKQGVISLSQEWEVILSCDPHVSPALAHSKYSLHIYWGNGQGNDVNVQTSYSQPLVCPVELHCLRAHCDNRLLLLPEWTWMFHSSNLANGCCNCYRQCPLEAFLAGRNLKVKIKPWPAVIIFVAMLQWECDMCVFFRDSKAPPWAWWA